MTKARPVVLAVHGGAGRLTARASTPPRRRAYEAALVQALRRGQGVLVRGGSAVRAVAETVAVLEDDELFNAGRGAVLCRDGTIELSASIMNGRDSTAGAVVGLTRTRNPVLAARAMMNHAHGLLFGAAGDDYAEAAGLEMVAPEYFHTPHRTRQWQRRRGRATVTPDHGEDDGAHGTVGAVALDRHGTLAAATSTGGLVNQLPGRVGDTPVIGAGTWASEVCAVSATGTGDAFARLAFARRVADLIELVKMPPERAARRALRELAAIRGEGGCILVDARGRLAHPFNAPHMLRGWVVGRADPQVTVSADDEKTGSGRG